MSHHTTGATIYHDSTTSWGSNSLFHLYDASQSTTGTDAYYEITDGQGWSHTTQGFSFHSVTGGTEFRVNEGDNTAHPATFTINSGSSQTSALIQANDVLKLYHSNGNLEGGFTVTAAMIFGTASGSGSGSGRQTFSSGEIGIINVEFNKF